MRCTRSPFQRDINLGDHTAVTLYISLNHSRRSRKSKQKAPVARTATRARKLEITYIQNHYTVFLSLPPFDKSIMHQKKRSPAILYTLRAPRSEKRKKKIYTRGAEKNKLQRRAKRGRNLTRPSKRPAATTKGKRKSTHARARVRAASSDDERRKRREIYSIHTGEKRVAHYTIYSRV